MKSQRLIGGHVSMAGGITNALSNGNAIGANCIQFFAGSPRTWDRRLFTSEEVTKFKSLQNKFGIKKTFIHALYLVNLASATDTLTKSLQALETDILNAQNLGSEGVIIHIGGYQRSWKDVKHDVIGRINDLAKISPQTVCILENSAGQNGKIGSLEELAEIIHEAKYQNLGICLDTAHLYAAGYDISNSSVMDDLLNQIKSFGLLEKISCIHLNDSRSGLGSHRDMHANLGEGQIGADGLKQFVTHTLLDAYPIILEVPGDPKAKNKGPRASDITMARTLAGIL